MLRIVTYIGLVIRRIWAKKGILLGSLLGATLVTSLLVIVPLYESSVSAIDLVFTIQNAPADRVDVVARVSTSDYSGDFAQDNRDVVAEQAQVLLPYYPEIIERTLSREYLFIPIDTGTPWLDIAETWRTERADALARIEAGEEEVSVPSPPWPSPPQEATQARFFSSPDLTERVALVEGAWPEADRPDADDPMPLVVGEDLARLAQLEIGRTLVLKPFTAPVDVFEVVEIVGIARAAEPADVVWGTSNPSRLMYLPQDVIDLWASAVPIVNSEFVFDPWLRDQRGMVSMDADQRWFLPLARDEVQLETKDGISSAIGVFKAEVARQAGIATDTTLPALLESFDVRAVVFGAPIFAMLALVVGGALYFLIYTAALTLEREGPELALLRTRGASSWQTIGIHLAQSLVIAGAAAALSPIVARSLVGLTGRIPPLSDLTGGQPLRVAQTDSLVPYIAAGAIVTFVSMGLAVLPIARRSVLELRSLAGRPTSQSIWQRYNLDLFAIALAAVILWVVASRGFIDTSGDETRLDPLAVVFPVLFLFATSLALLRVLPLVLRLVGWIMTRFGRMSWSLPGWHLGRNPVPYGRLALLVWLTTGFGAFALTYAGTLDTSFNDRAAFTVGADLRIEGEGVGYVAPPEGSVTAAVYRGSGAARVSASRQAELLAVVPEDFARVVSWRDDFGAGDPGSIFSLLRPEGLAPSVGIVLPDGTESIRVDGVVVPRSWRDKVALGDQEPDPSLRLLARVFDRDYRAWTLVADVDFVDSEWRTAQIDLSSSDALNDGPIGPIPGPVSLQSIWFERSQSFGSTRLNSGELLMDAFRLVGADGVETPFQEQVFEEMSPRLGMGTNQSADARQAVRQYYSELPEGEVMPDLATTPLWREGTVTALLYPTRSRVQPAPHIRTDPDPITVVLDRTAASIAGLDVGETTQFSIGNQLVPGTVVAFVDRVPTMNNPTLQGRMIIDLGAVNAWLNGTPTWSTGTNLARLETPDELWVATEDTDAATRIVISQLDDEPDAVITLAGQQADFSSRPVQVGLVAILFVGAFTGIVLALAGVTGYVLLAVSRRAREMGVLRALGFGRTGVATTFAVEQLVVLGLGAVIGVVSGVLLMWVMLPFLQLGETAAEIDPPVLLSVPNDVLGTYVAIVGVLLIASVVWATRRVSVRRMSEVLREVER